MRRRDDTLKKTYTVMGSIIILLIIILICIYIRYLTVDVITLGNLLLDIIVNLFFLLLTVFILENLFKFQQKKVDDRKELNRYLKSLKVHHDKLMGELKVFLVIFIVKSGYSVTENKLDYPRDFTTFDKFVNDYEKYIDENFINKPIELQKYSDTLSFDKYKEYLTYDMFLKENKTYILNKIEQYIMLYSKIIPVPVLKELAKIQSVLQNDSVFKFYDDETNLKKRESETLTDSNIINFKQAINGLLCSIVSLDKSINE